MGTPLPDRPAITAAATGPGRRREPQPQRPEGQRPDCLAGAGPPVRVRPNPSPGRTVTG